MEDFSIKPGIIGQKEMIVQSKDSAKSFGSGLIEVFATPAMIALMEDTAQFSVQKFLPEGYITLGTAVNIKHLKATPIGMKVKCESKLVNVEGKKLVFEVTALDEKDQIGIGTHTRCIVNAQKFMDKLSQID